MTIWCLMAAPLIMSNDLVNIQPEFRDILLNKKALKINQDELGIQGTMKVFKNNIAAWVKPILPLSSTGEYSYGVGFISYRDDGIKYPIDFTFEELGLDGKYGYDILVIYL